MRRLRDKLARVDPEFARVFGMEIPRNRLKNDLDESGEKIGMREITRMTLNAPSFPRLREELETLRRKNDME